MIKSLTDNRLYKHLTLKNGLKCLLISDPEIDLAAAALSVNAGGYDAPKDIPGLPHLLEHMLFYGSFTYPKENYFNEFLSQHGGGSNAFTSIHKTTYHFDISADFIEHGLDVFSHFFIDPIFNEEMILREVNAVDSEFYGNYNNDSRKQTQVLKCLMDKDYPVTNFSCGNKKTLCVPDLYKRMMEFYSTHYSSNRMNLVVSSKDTLDTLEKMVIGKFSTIVKTINAKCEHGKSNSFDNILPYDNFLKTNQGVPYVKIEPVKTGSIFYC